MASCQAEKYNVPRCIFQDTEPDGRGLEGKVDSSYTEVPTQVDSEGRERYEYIRIQDEYPKTPIPSFSSLLRSIQTGGVTVFYAPHKRNLPQQLPTPHPVPNPEHHGPPSPFPNAASYSEPSDSNCSPPGAGIHSDETLSLAVEQDVYLQVHIYISKLF
jgi:hypothetical protein